MARLLLLLFSFISIAHAEFSDFDLGVSVLTTDTNSADSYDVKGVLFMTFDGYDVALNKDTTLSILPTGIFVDVEGKQVQAYTDVGTLQYYGQDQLEIYLSAISIDYDKLDRFNISTQRTMAIADLNVVKYFSIGSFKIDTSFGVAVAGKSTQDISLSEEEEFHFSDTHFYSADAIVGANYSLTDTIDLYVYTGYSHQKNKNSELNEYSVGIHIYGFELGSTEIIPSVEYITKDYVSQHSGLADQFSSIDDSLISLGLKFAF